MATVRFRPWPHARKAKAVALAATLWLAASSWLGSLHLSTGFTTSFSSVHARTGLACEKCKGRFAGSNIRVVQVARRADALVSDTDNTTIANLNGGTDEEAEAEEGCFIPEADFDNPQLIFRIKVPEGLSGRCNDIITFQGPDKKTREVRLPPSLQPGDVFTVADQSYHPVEEFPVENPILGGPKESDWIENSNRRVEAGLGSVILLICAAISLGLANWAKTAAAWLSFWQARVGPPVAPPWTAGLTAQAWVNEGLMAMFFFSVGLEIKKEMVEGSLASPKKALLPCIAALGGMIMPMAVYAAIQRLLPGGSMAGVPIPMATDIAFAMGVFYSCRKYMPKAAEPLLLALATVDDLGAILVIAVCFAHGIHWTFLCAALGILGSTALSARQGIKTSWGFLVPGVLLWYCLLRGGVNADIAGVLVAFCIPQRTMYGSEVVARLIRRWSLLSAFIILPIFALANCGVPLAGGTASGGAAVPLGIFFGLLLGKPLGIFSFSWVSIKAGLAAMPTGMGNQNLLAIGMLGSIGFTMCLFLTEHSLGGQTAAAAKLAVFAASGIGGLLSAAFMMAGKKRQTLPS